MYINKIIVINQAKANLCLVNKICPQLSDEHFLWDQHKGFGEKKNQTNLHYVVTVPPKKNDFFFLPSANNP